MKKQNVTKKKKRDLHEDFTGPTWAWEIIWETIKIDMKSPAFDPKLRAQIKKANEAIQFVGKENP